MQHRLEAPLSAPPAPPAPGRDGPRCVRRRSLPLRRQHPRSPGDGPRGPARQGEGRRHRLGADRLHLGRGGARQGEVRLADLRRDRRRRQGPGGEGLRHGRLYAGLGHRRPGGHRRAPQSGRLAAVLLPGRQALPAHHPALGALERAQPAPLLVGEPPAVHRRHPEDRRRREPTESRPCGSCARPAATCPSTARSARSTRCSRSARRPSSPARRRSSRSRLGVDAAILFADILLPLEPMGAPFEFAKGEGPVIHEPIRDRAAHRQAARLRAARRGSATCSTRSSRIQQGARRQVAAHRLRRARRSRSRATSSRAARARTSRRRSSSCTREPDAVERAHGQARRGRAPVPARADRRRRRRRAALRLVGRAALARRLPRVRAAARRAHPAGRRERAACPSSTSAPARSTLLEAHARRGRHRHRRSTGARPSTRAGSAIGYDRARPGQPRSDGALRAARGRREARRSASSRRRRAGRGHIFNLGHGILPETPVDTVQAVIDLRAPPGSRRAVSEPE